MRYLEALISVGITWNPVAVTGLWERCRSLGSGLGLGWRGRLGHGHRRFGARCRGCL